MIYTMLNGYCFSIDAPIVYYGFRDEYTLGR
jgi:hypothetical protein